MGEMIHKPDANPILFAVLNLFFCSVGYFVMGQTKKGIMSLVIGFVASLCTLGLGFWVWAGIVVYDAYLLGQKLQQGESIGMNENGLSFLDAIFKD
ncbi:MAG: hypothetical protein KC912_00250 [Proteobacteria bacterium]|jgi:hypothetical protein|nr:hypothetical protein [Pseudomonadota bacterium]